MRTRPASLLPSTFAFFLERRLSLIWMENLISRADFPCHRRSVAMPQSPSFFVLRAPPGSSAWDLLDPEVRQVWSLRNELDQSQWLPPEQIEQRQLAEIRSLAAHCLENVPYYREQLTAAGVVPAEIRTLDDFRKIPILSRQTCGERAADLQARRLPAGMVPLESSMTSGTSGVPLKVFQTNLVRRWWWACNLRDLEWRRFDPRGTLAALRPPRSPVKPSSQACREGVSLPSWFPALDRLIVSGTSHGMDPVQEPRQQLEWLGRVAPNYLIGFPTVLEVLARLLREEGRCLPGLRGIQTISEVLTDEARRLIEGAFGTPVQDLYSCAEAGYAASPCPDGHGLHVHAEHVLLEVLDDAGRPCTFGQTGRVVLTTLHNYLAPFLRYEILDEATVGPSVCPCGRGLPLLTRVDGKRWPYFQLADRRLKHSSSLMQALYRLGGMRQFQVVQRAVDHLLIRLVPDRDWTPEHAQRVSQAVQAFMESSIRVDVSVFDRLERPASGKLRSVICELPPRSPEANNDPPLENALP
jgi:phenylacetate-CoA ligase